MGCHISLRVFVRIARALPAVIVVSACSSSQTDPSQAAAVVASTDLTPPVSTASDTVMPAPLSDNQDVASLTPDQLAEPPLIDAEQNSEGVAISAQQLSDRLQTRYELQGQQIVPTTGCGCR